MNQGQVVTYKLTPEEITEKFKDVKPYDRNVDGLLIKNKPQWYMRKKVETNDNQWSVKDSWR